MKHKQTFWNKFWKDSQGKKVLIQPANPPLIGWAVLTLLSKLLHHGETRTIIEYAAFACLVVWASLEAICGANYFRRTLGFAILFLSIYSRVAAA